MMRHVAFILALLVGLALVWPHASRAAALGGKKSTKAAPNEMTGMISAVDTQGRDVRVITGVGHAARIVVFHAGTECRIAVEGTQGGLNQLRRGLIVVVRYRKTSGGYEAQSMEARPVQPPRTRP